MRLLNIPLYKMVAIALTLCVPYSAYALPTIEEDQTVAYNSNRNNNDLLEIYGTLNNSARLTNNDVIDIYGYLNNNTFGNIINSTSGTINNFGYFNNGNIFTNSGIYNDYGQLINSRTFTNNLNAYVYADSFENARSGNFINNGVFDNGNHWVTNHGSMTNNGTMNTNQLENSGGTLINGKNGIFNAEYTFNSSTIRNEGEFNSYYNFENFNAVRGAGHFISNGNFLKNNGFMFQNSFQINNGTVSGSGRFIGDMTLSSDGNIAPDNTLTLEGDLTSFGDYYFGFYGGPFARESKFVVVNGETTFYEGVFNINFSDSYSLYDGLNLTLMTSNQFTGLENVTYKVDNLNANWSYKINTTGSDISISISAVPEPESYAMLIAGLVLVRLASRNRKLSLPA